MTGEKDVISVSPETKVTEVAKIIFEHNFNGLPVIGENNVVLGLITEIDLLAKDSFGIHIPSLVKLLSDFNVLKMVKGKERENLELIIRSDAQSIMNSDYVFVSPETSLTELMKIFNEKHVNPVPVVDENKKLRGIVSRSDVVKLVSRFNEAELDFLRNA